MYKKDVDLRLNTEDAMNGGNLGAGSAMCDATLASGSMVVDPMVEIL